MPEERQSINTSVSPGHDPRGGSGPKTFHRPQDEHRHATMYNVRFRPMQARCCNTTSARCFRRDISQTHCKMYDRIFINTNY